VAEAKAQEAKAEAASQSGTKRKISRVSRDEVQLAKHPKFSTEIVSMLCYSYAFSHYLS